MARNRYQIFSMGHGSVSNEIKGRRYTNRNDNGNNHKQTEATNEGQEKEKEHKKLVSITERGATFKSYHDGSLKFLSPEGAMDVQRQLGADLVLVLDECTPFHVGKVS